MQKDRSGNPLRAEPGWPPVVVAGGFQTGVLLMRNLLRRGLNVHCVEWFREQPCFRSVYGKSYQCPNPDDRPDEWLGFMIDLGRELGAKPVLIPTADQFVSAIGRYASELQEHYVFCHRGAAMQALLATKEQQYDLAAKHGLPVPRTQFVRCQAEMNELVPTVHFPCIFKPLQAREWNSLPAGHPFRGSKLAVAKSGEELLAKYRLIAEINPSVVVQEVIEGPDTAKLVYLSCYGLDGRRLGACMMREVRTSPIYFGSASVVEPVTDEEADALSDRFLRSIGYTGLCELELKRDSRDGRVKLIEANPRHSGTGDAAPYAGVDLAWLHYLDLIGQPVAVTYPDGHDFRHIMLVADLATFRNYLRDGLETWGSVLRSYRPPLAFFDFDLRDWRVSATTINRAIRALVGPPLRRVFPKSAKATSPQR